MAINGRKETTGFTMTDFSCHVWAMCDIDPGRGPTYRTTTVQALTITRIIGCLCPQNPWLSKAFHSKPSDFLTLENVVIKVISGRPQQTQTK